jgi:hypothetical protein
MRVDNRHFKAVDAANDDIRRIMGKLKAAGVPQGTIAGLMLELFTLVVAETTVPGEIDDEAERYKEMIVELMRRHHARLGAPRAQ